MAEALTLKIITPERIVLEQQVDEVSARAIDGDLTILPNHEPLITALGIDVLRFRFDKEEHSAAIIGGLLEVGENVVTVLSDTAELDTEIDVARAHEAKEKAAAQKLQRAEGVDTILTEMAMSRAIARLRAAELSRRRKGRHQ
jgi:F-type H+-transporting ATPase subunit epsilon